MTGKEERTKTEEMKNADKQGAETGHHGASGQTCGTSEYQTDLTPHTEHTGCSQPRHIKYLSDDENVRRRPSTNNNIKHQQQSQINQDLSTKSRQETNFNHFCSCYTAFVTRDKRQRASKRCDGEF